MDVWLISYRYITQQEPVLIIRCLNLIVVIIILMHLLVLGRSCKFAFAALQPSVARRKLIEIFQCKKSKCQLSTKLKILPEYFSKTFVLDFIESDDFRHYYWQKIDYEREEDEIDLRRQEKPTFSAYKLVSSLISPEVRSCLETYLNWLLHSCPKFNKYQNDYGIENLNMDRPDRWFQQRKEKRLFIYHHGPTNSGKSTAAVEQLRHLGSNDRGIYMAPLRLLAWEYQQKLPNCSLVTGQEKQYKNSRLISCTIEAAPLTEDYDVAVIDQIQMIGDTQRGWAWTKAILGVRARRVHLCGDERALGIVSKLLQRTGDQLEQRRYSRLSKLKLLHRKFTLQQIQQGDCLISFQVKSLINNRNKINLAVAKRLEAQETLIESSADNQSNLKQKEQNQISNSNKANLINKTAIVYGRLPPECRKLQAKLFNDRQLPYLVATNAIGMGLNLNLKKIIFHTLERHTANGTQPLEDHQIQQIAGRAGRGQETGYVQCSNASILKRVKKALQSVNKTYGIKLQGVREQNESSAQESDNSSYQQELSQEYSPLLDRFLRKKESSIRAAGFYFLPEYIISFKMYLQSTFGTHYPTVQIVNYLKTHSKIDDLCFLLHQPAQNYLFQLLQNYQICPYQLHLLVQGFSLSFFSSNIQPILKDRMLNAHRQYARQFAIDRRVDLPPFIIKMYKQQFKQYIYMDQVNELQFYFNLLETYMWLWGKFEFVFYQIKLARQIKQALANQIALIITQNLYRKEFYPPSTNQSYNSNPKSGSKPRRKEQKIYTQKQKKVNISDEYVAEKGKQKGKQVGKNSQNNLNYVFKQ